MSIIERQGPKQRHILSYDLHDSVCYAELSAVSSTGSYLHYPIQAGASPSNVALLLGITKRAVYNILKKYEESDSLKDRPRSGRPRVMENQADCDSVVDFRHRPFKLNRLHWAHEHERWTRRQWENVLFSDEVSFDVNINYHKIRSDVTGRKKNGSNLK